MNKPQLTASFFSIDGGQRFPGFHYPSESWNGWSCPWFTTETMRAILAAFPDPEGRYDYHEGQARFEHTPEGEPTYPMPMMKAPDGTRLHAFDGWCWGEDKPETVRITVGQALQADGTLADALGFEYQSTFIADASVTDCGRFPVDPITHYGLTPAQAATMAYSAEQKAFIVRAVLRGQTEIVRWINSGLIAPTVSTFADLHDYCDANEIGGLCEDAIADEGNALFPERTDPDTIASQGLMDACNVIQDALAFWVEDHARTIDEATQAALNSGCEAIQKALGVTDGGFAGLHFSGPESDTMREQFARYYWAELAQQ